MLQVQSSEFILPKPSYEGDDACALSIIDNTLLVSVLCDGVGSARRGGTAARQCVKFFIDQFKTRPKAPPVNLYVAYYASQRKGQSVHSPRTCIPGGGWKIVSLDRHSVDGITLNGQALLVNRTVIQMGDYRQLVYYWFQQRGRNLTNEYLVKWFLFWDALTRNRTDGALVRLTTLVPTNEKLSDADHRLVDFAKNMSPHLKDYIPE